MGEEEIAALLKRLEEEASEQRAEVVDDLVDALVVHGDGAEGEQVLLALGQQLLQEGLVEEEDDQLERAGRDGLEGGSEVQQRLHGHLLLLVWMAQQLPYLPQIPRGEREEREGTGLGREVRK